MAETFDDPEFLRRIIEIAIRNWSPESAVHPALSLLLPAEEAERLDHFFNGRTAELLAGGLQVTFDDKIGGGFRIGPADGRYVVSFTEKDFEQFFREYLKPRTSALLYGEK
jgi:V/A-type H+-transporting ATPase subunit E